MHTALRALPWVVMPFLLVLAQSGCELEDEESKPYDFVVVPFVTIQTTGENAATPLEGAEVVMVARKTGGHTVGGSCITGQSGECCWAFGFNLTASESFTVTGQVTLFNETWTGATAEEMFVTQAEGGAGYDQAIAHCGLAFYGRSMAPLLIRVTD